MRIGEGGRERSLRCGFHLRFDLVSVLSYGFDFVVDQRVRFRSIVSVS